MKKDIWTFTDRQKCTGENCNFTSILVHHPTKTVDSFDQDCVRGNTVRVFRKEVQGKPMGGLNVHEMEIFSSKFLFVVFMILEIQHSLLLYFGHRCLLHIEPFSG